MSKTVETEVVVLGSGPGGYTAAFRAADLGKKVTLVERYDALGGVCLNVGCIPSKALLNVAKLVQESKEMHEMGVSFGEPNIDIKQLRAWVKDKVIGRLTGGLAGLAKMRKVTVVHGVGSFAGPKQLTVTDAKGETTEITFEHAIIAAGSRPIKLPFMPEDPRVMDSTGALALDGIPEKLLIIGGGIIGMEMGQVYQVLGAKVSVVEMNAQLFAGVDKDLVAPLQKRLSPHFESMMFKTQVTKVEAKEDGLWVSFEGAEAPGEPVRYDKILQCVGRVPNGRDIGADKAGVTVDERGFIPVDTQMRTNVAHIFAIGDIAGNPMLAHKAIPEGKIAAEVIAGKKHFFEPRCIPNVAYTDPEIAWVGLTEMEAKEKNIPYEKGVFPWMASGRSLAMGREEGVTKVIYEKSTHRLLGAGIVGSHAGDLIAEAALAIEMGCEAEDIALTIHPHPTLSETLCQATEVYEGTITDLPPAKKK